MHCIYKIALLVSTFFITSLATPLESQDVNLDSVFAKVKYRNIGPFRGGRSVTASGVIGDQLTYYMGTTGGGLWKTEDAGQHWKNISDGFFKTGSVGAISVSESNPNILYCGMGEHAPRGVMTHHGDGVYKSIDAGKTWKHIGLTHTQHIARIEIHPTNPDIVYVAAQGALYGPSEDRGIYKSVDGGDNWEKVLYVNPNTGCSELSMDMNQPNILYAAMWDHQRFPWMVRSGGTGSGLYKSVDSGKTWKKIHKGLPKEMGKMAIDVSRANSDRVYALIESDTEKDLGGLFVSKNGGKSWSKVSGDNRLTQRAWYYIEVFAGTTNEHEVYVMSAPALRSIDGGKTWERITGTHGDFHDLWIHPENPKNLCIANDGGAAISFNHGKSWSRQDNMPTSQFYRVIVDNEFPYNIYAGQQDNSSVKIPHRALNSTGITPRHWTYSAGGESAFLAFDPDSPTKVMGGSYLGTINLLHTNAEATTKVMPSPIQYLGREARDMKYLYNWNAPIIKSSHEPNTYYHGAQLLLKTTDEGVTWTEASPDLTRDDDTKQGKGGGPYTNEAVGAENYGTLSYVIESPHEAGVIWTGSDDGLVHITRDNGDNWINVTPNGLTECLINAIDISPHDPSTAYIATTRYKFNDHRPGLYKTTDYGKTWSNISGDIPQGAFTRVIREDEQRKDLLVAGTELGLFVSWDGGKKWYPFNLNLPVTPITDLTIKHGDLIVATSGRSFWILDDMGLIRDFDGLSGQAKLYQPEDTYLANGRSPLSGNSPSFKGTNPLVGVNPANGVVLYYELPKLKKGVDVHLDIMDNDKSIVRSLTSKKSTSKTWAGGPPRPTVLSKDVGLNRVVWDTRAHTMNGVSGAYIEANYRGHKMVPGSYTARLTVGEDTSKVSFDLLANPRYPTTTTEYKEYDEFMSSAEANLIEMHDMINKLHKYEKRMAVIKKSLEKDKTKNKALLTSLDTVHKSIKKWDEDMIQRKAKAYDDVENFRNKFTAEYLFMINASESDLPKINQPSRDRRNELDKQWAELKKRGTSILETTLPQLNEQLWRSGVGALE